MRSVVGATVAYVFAATAAWADCPPNALGTARTIAIDPTEHGRIGTIQYAETLPLGDKEVVLTFDDGPLPPYSTRILDILAAECTKATFFIVGHQAQEFPDLVRRAYDEGHTIATHSQSHPRRFDRLPVSRIAQEIDGGVASTAAALGDARAVAPFFRTPGLRTSAATESYLASRAMMMWSADFTGDDWRRISAKQVLQRALDRLETKGKGVLLLHDIQPATVLALPDLLKQLKARGFRVVQVVPAGPERPKTVTASAQWAISSSKRSWPRIVEASVLPQLPVPSPQSFGWPHPFQVKDLVATKLIRLKPTRRHGYQTARVVEAHWPASPVGTNALSTEAALPAPSPQSFGIPHPFGPNITLPLPQLPPQAVVPKPTASVDSGTTLSSVGLP